MGRASYRIGPQDSEFLAALRSLSIFIIVFGHVGGFWFYRPWSEFLHVFVPVFFFISGAVSYNAFLNSASPARYLRKRIVNLLVPYYCICLVALLMYIIQKAKFPELDMGGLYAWATIMPPDSSMPFPLGQVWFLHTLLVILLASPLLFRLYNKSPVLFLLFLCCPVSASAIQTGFNIAPFFEVAGHGLFKPFVHALFFCAGFMVFDLPRLRSPITASCMAASCLVSSIAFVGIFGLDPDYAKHTYSPDLYYVAGSFCAIWSFILLKPHIMKFYERLPALAHGASHYFFRHTYSIFLLHSLSIFFVQKVFGLAGPAQKTIFYGLVKLALVLSITLAMCPAFTKAGSFISRSILSFTSGLHGSEIRAPRPSAASRISGPRVNDVDKRL